MVFAEQAEQANVVGTAAAAANFGAGTATAVANLGSNGDAPSASAMEVGAF